jgi:hypothetical protein
MNLNMKEIASAALESVSAVVMHGGIGMALVSF